MDQLDEQLFLAAREGDTVEVVRLLEKGADPNAVLPGEHDHGSFLQEVTPLMAAVASSRSSAATVTALLHGGADINVASSGGVTVTWYAAGGGTGYPLTPKALADLSQTHPYRNWGGGDVDRLRLILDAGGDPNECADNGRSALGEACAIGDPARVRLLIERGASVWPAKSGTQGISEFAAPLFRAAESGNVDSVRLILESGFPVDFRVNENTALDEAGTVEVAELLWDLGLRPTGGKFGFDTVDIALEDERYSIARFFLDRLKDGEGRQEYLDERLLTSSGVHMDPVAIEMLLELGADANHVSEGFGSPLHTACWQGDGNGGRETSVVEETLELLISAEADVNARDARGAMPLHEAAGGDWGAPTSVRVLLAHQAQVDARDFEGRTPLMVAASRGELECARLLMNAGADTSVQDHTGKTAKDYAILHLAAWQRIVISRKPSVAEQVLGAGSDFGDSHVDQLQINRDHGRALVEAAATAKLLGV